MKKLVSLAMVLIPVSIFMSKWIWEFSAERYIITALTPENYFLHDPLYIFYMILQVIADMFLFFSPLVWFAIRELQKRDRWFYIIRSFFIMHFIFRVPALFFTFLNFQPGWDNAEGYYAIIYTLLKLFISVVLWKCLPSGSASRITLNKYPMYLTATKAERALHHITDIIVFVATSATWMGSWDLELSPLFIVYIALVIIIFYFLYFFLAEAILGQTPGQSLTNSCPVGRKSPMSVGKAFLRSLGRLIPFDRFSFLWGKNWHDRLSGTTVVRRNSWKDIPFEGER